MIRNPLTHRILGAPRLVAMILVTALLAALSSVSLAPAKANTAIHRISVADAAVQEGNTHNAPPGPGETEQRTILRMTVTLGPAPEPAGPVSVQYRIVLPDDPGGLPHGTARPSQNPAGAPRVPNDYDTVGGTLVFPAGSTQQFIDIPINGDTHGEPAETIFVRLENAQNATISDPDGVGTIENDDGPAPHLKMGNVTVTEGGVDAENNPVLTKAVFPLELDPVSTQPVTVKFTITPGSPAATAGTDYLVPDQTVVTIPAGTKNSKIEVDVKGDKLNERNEVFNVNLSQENNAIVDNRFAVGTITDDDPAPKFSIFEKTKQSDTDTNNKDVRLPEGNPASANDPTRTEFAYVVRLHEAGNPNKPITSGKGASVVVSTRDISGAGAATAGSDYESQSVTLNFGTTETQLDFVVDGMRDTTIEPSEKFEVFLSQPNNGAIENGVATGTIVDDDGSGPRVSIAPADTDPNTAGVQNSYTEGASGTTKEALFNISIPTPPALDGDETAKVKYKTVADSAKTDDFKAETGIVTWTAGDVTPAQLTKQVSITINGDGVDEADEQFYVELEAVPDGRVTVSSTLAERRAAAIIEDDDCEDPQAQQGCPTVSVTDEEVVEPDAPATLPENRATMTFTITLTPASGQTVTVTPSLVDDTATGGAGNTSDYTRPPTNPAITFAPGETVKTYNVTVNGDDDPEPAEERFLLDFAVVGANRGDLPGVGTILDNDGAAPVIKIANAGDVTEGNSGTTNATFVLTRNNTTSTQTMTVKYKTVDGTAKADRGTADKFDYAGTQTGSITFGAGAATANINIPVNGDVAKEGDEDFFVELISASNANISEVEGEDIGKAVIKNDDTAPLNISVGDASASEDKSIEFPVTLAARPGEVVTVKYATSDGTAKAATDYVAKSGTLTFAVDSNPTQKVEVALKEDTTDEPDETMTLTLSEPSATAAVQDGTATGTVVDNDSPPAASISDATANEGAGSKATFTVTLSAPSANEVKIDFTTEDGTGDTGAKQPGDYTTTTQQLTFAPGETQKTVDVPVVDDNVSEDAETFSGKITSPDPALVTVAKDTGTATIQDNDGTGDVSVADAAVSEGNSGTSNLVFKVTRTGANNRAVTAKYSTRNGTATAPDDYEPTTGGTVTIPAGATEANITVPVKGDLASEGNETLFVDLTESNANLVDPTGRGTINDDDAPPAVAEITTGPGPGGGPHVRSYTDTSGNERRGFMLGDFDEGLGATVARGDVDPSPGDEIITGTNDGPPVVRIWSAGGQFLDAVQIFEDEYDGGISVAVGNFDDDAVDELVAASGPGNESRLAVFEINGDVVDILDEYAPYGAFTGGVFVAAGDIDGDGKDDIATGPGPGGGPHVKVWFDKGNSDEFFPYPAAFAGGVRVAIGSDDNENYLVTGAGPGGGPHVGVFDYTTTAKPGLRHEVSGFYAYDARVSSGISVAVGDIDGDGLLDIVTGAGPGGGPHVQGFSPGSQHKGGFFAYACNAATFPRDCFTNGVWVAIGKA